jgi:hypothetical protein
LGEFFYAESFLSLNPEGRGNHKSFINRVIGRQVFYSIK